MNRHCPDTRHSLILRLSDRRDIAAWDEFSALYRPLVFRLALSRGLQEADAHDVAQDVFLSIAKAVGDWKPDREHGRFRDWLYRVARNLTVNYLTRRKHLPWSAGGSDLVQLLHEQCDPRSVDAQAYDLELRREQFWRAADVVRTAVRPTTWDAFRLTYLDGNSVESAAEALGISVGAVHVARCRVVARLREYVRILDESESTPTGEFESKGGDA
jgi:RNA polymerase sigma-70 factor (ECF subfamily)